MSIFLAVNWDHSHNKWIECVQSAGYFVTFLVALSARFINNWSLNKGLFPSSMQKCISIICGLRTSENSAWWSRSKPDNKRCASLALKACYELPFLFIICPLRDCGSSRFTRPSLSILRLRDRRSSRFNLGSDSFCLTAKNQTIGDDTNGKKGYHVPSSQCSSVRFIE